MSRSTRSSELRGTAQPALVAERERIARELHKFTVYRLFGIGLTLQALSLKGGDPAVSVHLNECVQELDLAISELRGLVFKLDDRHTYSERVQPSGETWRTWHTAVRRASTKPPTPPPT
jgi:signal transduction histidine kinase